jgi:CHAT domain-containing protein
MKRIVLTAALIVIVVMPVCAQDLKSDWARIQSYFMAGHHDSVIVYIRPFIVELEKRNLYSQLSVAQYHLGVSLAQLGNMAESETAFARARDAARQANEPERLKEITFKHIQLYLTLARAAEKQSANQAISHYTRALTLASESGDPALRGTIHYQRGLLYKSLNDDPNTIRDFEEALKYLPSDAQSRQVRSALSAQLTTLYLNTGQSEKARQITEGADGTTRVEYTIKLAVDAEQRGDFKKADELLAAIQTEMLTGQAEGRVLDFVKKRYSLYEAQGRSDAGMDTLRSIVRVMGRVGVPASTQLQVQQLLALLLVQHARVQEAAGIVDEMEKLIARGKLPAAVLSILDETRADIAYLRGDNQNAIASYRRVLANAATLKKENRLTVLNNLGLALTRDGQDAEALASFDQMRALASDPGDISYRIQADLNAGIILVKQDRTRDAVERFKRAKEDAGNARDLSLEIMASLRLAEAYRRSGYDNLADELFEEVRSRQSQLTNPFNRIQVLQALSVYAKGPLGSYKALSDLRQAYTLATQIGAVGYLGTLAGNLADTYFAIDSLEAARRHYRAALQYFGSTADVRMQTELSLKLGQCYLAEGKFDDARNEIKSALARLVRTPVSDPVKVSLHSIVETDLYGQGLASLAFVDYSHGRRTNDIRRLLTSLEEVQKSVELLESRQLAQLSRAQKEAESVRNVNAYRLLVDICAALYDRTQDSKYFELAFNTSEKSRAQAFVAEVGTQLVTKINDPRAKEAAKIASALVARAPTNAGLALDITQGAGATRGLVVTDADESRSLEKIQGEYESILQKLSAEDTKVAQLISVNILNFNSLRTLLEPGEVILSYYVSIDKCHLFLITPAAVKLRTINWLPEDMAATVEAFRAAVQDYNRNDYRVFGKVLYDSLVAPVVEDIAGKQVVIIPSGRLNTLPFGALWRDGKFLLEEHDLAVIPNASTLQFIRTGKKLSPNPTVFALGNPNNPRVSRLPGTESEVNSIKSIYTNSHVVLGSDASESTAKDRMAAFEIVHIACHGLFNYEFPLLSSLALSPDDRNDGFLQVHELYNLNLTNTNLVILSACETGLARIKKNDDVIGLVRGFLYAGVPSMVASLWKVDDYATSILMSNFHLLLKLGNSKSEALRKSQMQVMRTPLTAHPFFWAAFVLYGNPQ